MSFTLRPHQQENFDQLRRELSRVWSTILVAECGYGKGVITTKIIEGAAAKGKHVLFLVHGRDRVNDMDDRVTRLGVPHGVLMGSKKRERWHSVQIASSDTVHRMEHKPKADLIIIDETHLAMSPTFRGVLNCYPQAKILGLTATPILGNGKALGVLSGGIYESMVRGPSVTQLIAEGSLVRSRVFAPEPPAELKVLKKTSTGEFDGEQGAAICDNSKVIGDVVAHWKKLSSDRKTVVFGFNQKHAFDIAESFRAAGVNWAYVDANTPDGDIHTPGTRKFIWEQYDRGDLVGVSSCQTISIGWDHSICKCLVLASKTSSFPLFRQRLGRGSRPHPGFSDFLVLDHCAGLWEFKKQGPYFESEIDWQLDGDPIRPDADKAKRVKTCKIPVAVSEHGIPSGFNGSIRNGYMLPCMKTFPPGPEECPYCGIPILVTSREIEHEDGDLQEVSEEARQLSAKQIAIADWRNRMSPDDKKRKYLELVATGKERGYKDTWASVKYKVMFGAWPLRAWLRHADTDFSEPEWGSGAEALAACGARRSWEPDQF